MRDATLGSLRALGGEARKDAIREHALAAGGFTPRELAAAPPEGAAQKFDRLVDYQLAWELTNLRRDGLVENPCRSVWRLAGAARVPAAPASLEHVPADDRLTAEAYGRPERTAREQPPRRSLLRRLLAG